MSRSIRITAILMVILMVASIFCTTALAASVSGSAASSKTFTIKTGSNWFVSPKVTIQFQKGSGVDQSTMKTVNKYSLWTIKVYDSKGKCVQSKQNYGYSGVTISGLKRNTTYKIKITENKVDRIIAYRVKNWNKNPSWYVSSTKNIKSIK